VLCDRGSIGKSLSGVNHSLMLAYTITYTQQKQLKPADERNTFSRMVIFHTPQKGLDGKPISY
jgi:hypothetical protein